MQTDQNKGTINLIFLEVGVSTTKFGALQMGDAIVDVVGPLGNPSEIKYYGPVTVVCGGVGTAAAYPIAKGLKEADNHVISIIGARTQELLILEDEMRLISDELYISTDDGSKGHKGFVSDVLMRTRWRRSYETRPPELTKSDDRYPGNDPRYTDLRGHELPVAESPKDTFRRVIPYWKNTIVPEIKSGKKVLIVAHGNSLRALVKYLDNISDKEIVKLNLPTGIPLVYARAHEW